MTIKAFAFEVQSTLSKTLSIDLKRSHVHEVLAALFGFASYAALTTQRLLGQHDGTAEPLPLDIASAADRAAALGYSPPAPPLIAAAIARAAEDACLCVLTVNAVLWDLGIETGDRSLKGPAEDSLMSSQDDDEPALRVDDVALSIDLGSPILRESLLRTANAGNASAHLALAEIADDFLSAQANRSGDGGYWFEQQQSGRHLTGVELEWANSYRDTRRDTQEAASSRELHLRSAIALGSAEAALKQLDRAPSDEHFEVAVRLAGPAQAARLGYVALYAERVDEARTWFRLAARHGDTDAMKVLASNLDLDLKEAWSWVYLAKLLGVNVMAYHAIDEDGNAADADEAGPIYGAGGFELDPLSASEDAEARTAAARLYAQLPGNDGQGGMTSLKG